jgi:hypothetical protein
MNKILDAQNQKLENIYFFSFFKEGKTLSYRPHHSYSVNKTK